MAEFLYLYRGAEPIVGALQPQQAQDYLQKFQNWILELTTAGKIGSCGPLAPDGRVIAGPKAIITDGPFAEAKDIVGGYSVVTAADIDEATELARNCPFLQIGGVVEIRSVLPVK